MTIVINIYLPALLITSIQAKIEPQYVSVWWEQGSRRENNRVLTNVGLSLLDGRLDAVAARLGRVCLGPAQLAGAFKMVAGAHGHALGVLVTHQVFGAVHCGGNFALPSQQMRRMTADVLKYPRMKPVKSCSHKYDR
jgi:hypothetical protein